MGESAENSSDTAQNSQHPNPILDYRTPDPEPRPVADGFSARRVLAPFALGAMLPFIFLSVKESDIDGIWIGAFVTWGLCAILLIAIKIRGAVVLLDSQGRPWWLNTVAGVINSLVFYIIILNTTGRVRYSEFLGDGGTLLVAIFLRTCVRSPFILVPNDEASG